MEREGGSGCENKVTLASCRHYMAELSRTEILYAQRWVCVCVYAAGREWEEAGKTQSDFSTPPSVFRGCRMGPGGCGAGVRFAPLSQAGCLRMPSCFAWGRLAGLWGPGRLCSQPCPPRPAPALGLCSWAGVRLSGKLRGDYNGPAPFQPASASGQKDGREVRGNRESCFSLPLVILCLFFAIERDGI